MESGADNGGGALDALDTRVSSIGAGIYARRIGAAGVGSQWIIDAGFISAVDIWGNGAPGEVCLEGLGSLLFIDTGVLPRVQSWLDSTQRDGHTCAELDRPGMLVLMPAAAQSQQCPVTTTGQLRVRSGPSLAAGTLGFLRRGVSLRPISRRGNWIEIAYGGETGWVGAAYVKADCGGSVVPASGLVAAAETDAPAAAQSRQCPVITTGVLRVRSGPSLDDITIGFVRAGIRLRPISRRGNWIEIAYEGETGWIGAAYVKVDCGGSLVPASGPVRVDETDAPAAAQSQQCPVITTGQLRVRSGPSLAADTLGFLRRGVSLRPISRRGDWLSFDYQGETGWVGAAYVKADCGGSVVPASGPVAADETDAPAAAQSQQCPVTTTGRLRVRSGPSLNADTLGFLRRGIRLRPISRRGSWIEIAYGGETGWIGAGFVSGGGDCG